MTEPPLLTPEEARRRCRAQLDAFVQRWEQLDEATFLRAGGRNWHRIAPLLPGFLEHARQTTGIPDQAAQLACDRLQHRPDLAGEVEKLCEICLLWQLTSVLWDHALRQDGRDWASRLARDRQLAPDIASAFVEELIANLDDPARRFELLEPDRLGQVPQPFEVHQLHEWLCIRLPDRWQNAQQGRRRFEARHGAASAIDPPDRDQAISWERSQIALAQFRVALAWCVVAAGRTRRDRSTFVGLLGNPFGRGMAGTESNRRTAARQEVSVRLGFVCSCGRGMASGLVGDVAAELPLDVHPWASNDHELAACVAEADRRLTAAARAVEPRLAEHVAPAIASCLDQLDDPPASGLRDVLVAWQAYLTRKLWAPRGKEQLAAHIEGALRLGALVRTGTPPAGRGVDPRVEDVVEAAMLGEPMLVERVARLPTAEEIIAFVDAQSHEPHPTPDEAPRWWRWTLPTLLPLLAASLALLWIWTTPAPVTWRGVPGDQTALQVSLLPASAALPASEPRELLVELPAGEGELHLHVLVDGAPARRLPPLAVVGGERVVSVPGPYEPGRRYTIVATVEPAWAAGEPCAAPWCAAVDLRAP